ncbi:hypothetical protein [Paenisporosarcina antarctica]|uniref:Uncharacterized protein n=1 Tax=Paenisporosarcina antarctica TaxID=417367 RepID=A0A4P6ZW13_9BACL|nr:hypothetical protein [Paenisporosarcina antarctica]QBP40238.1 hypothetical protein E2636_03330 [Paenisporosarcina antarctica]
MNKKTTGKWISGIAATVTVASFIGFVQMNQIEADSNTLTEVRGHGDLQSDNIPQYYDDESHEEDERYEDDDDDDEEYEDDEEHGSRGGEEYQGMQVSERRTSRS